MSGCMPSRWALANSLTIFQSWVLAWSMRPSMELLVSRRMASWTVGWGLAAGAWARAGMVRAVAARNVQRVRRMCFSLKKRYDLLDAWGGGVVPGIFGESWRAPRKGKPVREHTVACARHLPCR